MPRNRFTKSQRHPEHITIGLVYDFVVGLSAGASAERLGIHEKTARKYYSEIRNRYIELVFAGSRDTSELLPEPNDLVWLDIYACMFECPNKTETDYEFSQPDNAPNWNPRQRQQSLRVPRRRYLKQCQACTLEKPFEIAETLDFNITMVINNQRGFDKRNFGYLFTEQFIRRFIIKASPESSTPIHMAHEILTGAIAKPL